MFTFEAPLPLKEQLVATFNEMLAPISGKYVVVQGMNIPISTQKYKFFRSPSYGLL